MSTIQGRRGVNTLTCCLSQCHGMIVFSLWFVNSHAHTHTQTNTHTRHIMFHLCWPCRDKMHETLVGSHTCSPGFGSSPNLVFSHQKLTHLSVCLHQKWPRTLFILFFLFLSPVAIQITAVAWPIVCFGFGFEGRAWGTVSLWIWYSGSGSDSDNHICIIVYADWRGCAAGNSRWRLWQSDAWGRAGKRSGRFYVPSRFKIMTWHLVAIFTLFTHHQVCT